jgi:hypothetical protein
MSRWQIGSWLAFVMVVYRVDLGRRQLRDMEMLLLLMPDLPHPGACLNFTTTAVVTQ